MLQSGGCRRSGFERERIHDGTPSPPTDDDRELLMRIRKVSSAAGKGFPILLVLLAFSTTFGLIVGIFVPTDWHIPTLIVVAMPFTALAAWRVFLLLRTHSQNQAALIKWARATEKETAEFRRVVEKLYEGVTRIEGRAHSDEVRMRQVGQLAKKAAETGEELLLKASVSGINTDPGCNVRPEVSVLSSGGKAIGRLAAAVRADPERHKKLGQALAWGSGRNKEQDLAVALVGTANLAEFVANRGYATHQLTPGVDSALRLTPPPIALVIEEAVFRNGPWSGTDRPQGTALLEELRRTCEVAKSRGISVYLVKSSGSQRIYTRYIRELAEYSFPSAEFSEPWASEMAFGLMGELQEYAERNPEE